MARRQVTKVGNALRIRSKSAKTAAASSPTGIRRLPIELLQEVFSYLDIWTLLRCRGVCRLWTQSIPGNSRALRHALFVPLPKNTTPTSHMTIPKCKHLSRVMILGPFGPLGQYAHATDYVIHPNWGYVYHLQEQGITVNPMLLFHLRASTLLRLRKSYQNPCTPRPLWMTMFACEPPTQQLDVHFYFIRVLQVAEKCAKSAYSSERTLRNVQGVTVGEVLSATYDAMEWPRLALEHALGHGRSALIHPTKGMEMY